jgi:tRNA pseudouridine13 synthase
MEATLPYATSDLPGIGGKLRVQLEDFQVEEVPAYTPCGEGEHVYAWVEKRNMTTPALLGKLANALGIAERDIGAAGMKDKLALTRQWISLPPGTNPDNVLALKIEGTQILRALRHGNKLRTGHLKGNRFVLRVRELNCLAEEAQERCQAILNRLSEVPGAPNWYGAQRFGRSGNNAQIGKALVTKTKISGKAPRGRQRRLYISAYQSQLFNLYLQKRLEDELYSTVLSGDVLQKRDSGGMFANEDLQDEQKRFDTGQLSLTGPMFGHRMKFPKAETQAAERETQLLNDEELSLESFSHLGKLAQGTRRPLSVLLENAQVAAKEDFVEVSFGLPAGSYATAIMREIMKGPNNFPI